MHAKSTSSFFTSLMLHAIVVAVVFLLTVYVAKKDDIKPVIFELVAGPPTAMGELVAPAKGTSPTATKLDVPKVVLPPDPAPAAEETPKTVQTPPAKEETVQTPPKPTDTKAPKATDAKPKPDRSIAQQMKQKQRVSYKEYLKSHPTPKPQPAGPPRAANVPHVDYKGIAGGVLGGSTANTRGGEGGKALTREQQSALDTYITFLKQALKEAHEPPSGLSDKLEAEVTFDVSSAGVLRNPRITKPSGDRTFDKSVIDACRRAPPIGPTPTGKSYTWSLTFRMKDDD